MHAQNRLASAKMDVPLRVIGTSLEEQVYLNVYDVTNTPSDSTNNMIMRINNVTRDIGWGGVFHGAIEVYGQEWSFGYCEPGSGVYACAAKKNVMYSYRESVYLGTCSMSKDAIRVILQRLRGEWQGRSYDLLSRNCCHFCNELATLLGVQQPPGWLNRFAAGADATVRFTNEATALAKRLSAQVSASASTSAAWLRGSFSRLLTEEHPSAAGAEAQDATGGPLSSDKNDRSGGAGSQRTRLADGWPPGSSAGHARTTDAHRMGRAFPASSDGTTSDLAGASASVQAWMPLSRAASALSNTNTGHISHGHTVSGCTAGGAFTAFGQGHGATANDSGGGSARSSHSNSPDLLASGAPRRASGASARLQSAKARLFGGLGHGQVQGQSRNQGFTTGGNQEGSGLDLLSKLSATAADGSKSFLFGLIRTKQDAVGEDGMFAARSGVGQPMPADGTACAAGPAAAVGASAASALQPPAAPASPGSMQAHARPMMPPSPQVFSMSAGTEAPSEGHSAQRSINSPQRIHAHIRNDNDSNEFATMAASAGSRSTCSLPAAAIGQLLPMFDAQEGSGVNAPSSSSAPMHVQGSPDCMRKMQPSVLDVHAVGGSLQGPGLSLHMVGLPQTGPGPNGNSSSHEPRNSNSHLEQNVLGYLLDADMPRQLQVHAVGMQDETACVPPSCSTRGSLAQLGSDGGSLAVVHGSGSAVGEDFGSTTVVTSHCCSSALSTPLVSTPSVCTHLLDI